MKLKLFIFDQFKKQESDAIFMTCTFLKTPIHVTNGDKI